MSYWEVGLTNDKGIMYGELVKAKTDQGALKKAIKKYGFNKIHYIRRPSKQFVKENG